MMNGTNSPPKDSTEGSVTSPKLPKTSFHIEDEQPPRRSTTRSRRASQRASLLSSVPTAEELRRRLSMHLVPDKPVGKAPTFWQSLRSIICASYINILLVCIPVSWVLHFIWPNPSSTQDTLIFVFAFLAIVPLAKLLAFATDELSMRVGQTLAGLLNATLGNAVELIVAILALIKCELQVVQSSLVGSILSNLLLVLGMCFFAGGTRFAEQGFGISSTQLNSSLLTLSVIALLLPAAFHFSAGDFIADPKEGHDILAVSHGAALILLFIYMCYLFFQLFSHKNLYDDKNEEIKPSVKYPPRKKAKAANASEAENGHVNGTASGVNLLPEDRQTMSPRTFTEETHNPPDLEAGSSPSADNHSDQSEGTEEGPEEPSMSVSMTIGLLVVVTVLVAVTAEWLVDSIDGLASTGKISKEFIGVILLPIVGNAAEHVTAVTVSIKDKLTLSLGVAVGSSIQIALFVIPFIVTLGWIIGKPLTLLFDPFESIVLFLSVIVVNYTVQDGRSNWLEGMILMCLYVMLAVVFWFYPGVNISQQLANC